MRFILTREEVIEACVERLRSRFCAAYDMRNDLRTHLVIKCDNDYALSEGLEFSEPINKQPGA